MTLNFEEYKDKVYACWIGKNIGGTMGAPFEGKREVLDIKGFTTPKNEVLPNDDLDLQIVWLHALEKIGPYQINTKILGELWLSFITPSWNEYGFCKNNLKNGLVSPLSGDYNNSYKHSNGAWIRSEIWATTTPGNPDIAAKYSIEDALVDHGIGEGTFASAFVTALQSTAFIISDINDCIKIALSKIPETSRVYLSVKKVLECYENNISPRDARNIIQNMNADIGDGWFEAPSNVAYAILGLVYGKGDFKKSMILAINCGDDTDCTAATVGATLGILGGTKAIPNDWKEYIGDNIITIAINRADGLKAPKTCSALSERIFKLAPIVLSANNCELTLSNNKTDIPTDIINTLLSNHDAINRLNELVPYSFDTDIIFANVTTIYDGVPEIKPNEIKKITLHIKNNSMYFGNIPYNLLLKCFAPKGFKIKNLKKNIRLPQSSYHGDSEVYTTFTITAPDEIESTNRIVIEISSKERSVVGYIPITFIG